MRAGAQRRQQRMVVTAAVAAYGGGWLLAKNPAMETIGDTQIKTGVAIGAVGTFLGMFGRGRMSDTIGGVGLGFLLPALATMGREQGA